MELAIAAGVVGLAFLVIVTVNHPRYLAPMLLGLGLVLCRPSVFGERMPWLGPAVVLVGAVLAAVSPKPEGEVRRFPVWPIWFFVAGYFWLVLRESLIGDDAFNLVSSSATVFLPVFAFMLVARNPDVLRRTSNVFVWLVTAASASVAVSVLVGLVVGYGALRMGTLPLGYEKASTGMLFPFSLSYGANAESIPRFLGLGREPGMGAIYIGYAFFAMPDVKRRLLFRAVLLAALLATQSTAGIGIFAVCLGLHFVWGQHKFRPFVALMAVGVSMWAIYLALYDTTFGFLTKQDTVSTTDRTRATSAGLEALFEQPFTASTTEPLSSINMIAGVAVTGAPWFMCMVLFMAAPLLVAGWRKKWTSYATLFILATMMTSQPLYGSTGVMILAVILLSADSPVSLPGAGSAGGHADPAHVPGSGRGRVGERLPAAPRP